MTFKAFSIILAISFVIAGNSIFAQNLNISETLDYLSELCNKNSSNETEFKFTMDGKKVKVIEETFVPSYEEICKSIITVDVRNIRDMDLVCFPDLRVRIFFLYAASIRFVPVFEFNPSPF